MSELPFMGTEEAAEKLGVHPETVRRFCREGSLRAQHIGSYWAISREDVGRLRKRRRELEREREENVPKRQERGTRSMEHLNNVVLTCPRCGLKTRSRGGYASHRTACERLFRQLEEEPEPDEWRTDTDEYDPVWLRRLRKESA